MSTTTSSAPSGAKVSKVIVVALWFAQLAMGALFAMAGFMKLTTPISELAFKINWADDLPELLVRFIGLSELAGGIGLILPALTRIKPHLTPLAAKGLLTIMFLAAIFHVTRGEMQGVAANTMLAAPLAFIFWGRTRKAVIAPR